MEIERFKIGERVEAYAGEDTCYITLEYPRNNKIKAIQIGLSEVRAADDVRIEYDFARDGWSIKQASKFCWKHGDPVCDMDWQEVAFVQAWAREDLEHRKDVTGS